MAAEISSQLTASAEVNLTTAALAGAQPVPLNSGEDSCGNNGHGDSIVSVDVPNGGGDEDDDGEFDRFDDLELGAEDGAVPLRDILDKFEAASNGLVAAPGDETDGFVSQAAPDTAISATVNVSTLDLSDPESIHRHLSQLNDTVLKVSTACIRLNNDDNENIININNNGHSPDDFHFQASTSSPSSSCSLDPQIPPAPQTPTPATPFPSSASSPLPPPLETLPSASSTTKQSAPFLAQPPPITSSNAITINLPNAPFPKTSPPKKSPQQNTSASGTKIPSSQRKSAGSGKSTPQACTTCSKTFSNASALAKHRLTHSEERKYHCSQCSKAFKRQDHLNGHLLTHRTTKPFACLTDGCGKSYCDARSLRRHKENHHSGDKDQDSANGSDTEDIASGVTVASTPTLTVSTVAMPVPKEMAALSSGLTATLVQNNNSDHNGNNASRVLSNDNQLLRGDLPASTKVTAKGLSPQQFQLIERLFKNSKNLTTSTTSAACDNGRPTTTSATTSISFNPNQEASLDGKKTDSPQAASHSQASFLSKSSKSKISSAVSSKAEGSNAASTITPAPDRPVECTICSRKFKNIPALNGHMRLHGGYYKKDADGKRIIPQDAGGGGGHLRPLLQDSASRKRLQDGVNSKQGKVPPISPRNINIIGDNNGDPSSRLSESPPHKKLFLESESSEQSESSPPSFRCLPPPDTSQLLANLERKTKEEQQAAVAAVAAAAVQLPTPPTPPPPPPPPHPPLTPLTPFPIRHVVSPLTPISSPPALVIKPASVQPPPPPIGLHVRRRRRPHLIPDPDRDKTPRVGAQFQADIPDLRLDRHSSAFLTPDPADRVWDPSISVSLETRSPCGPLQSYLRIASSCLLPGGSRNEELALETLAKHAGNVHMALRTLMTPSPISPCPSSSSSVWSEAEVNGFYECLLRHHKNFSRISSDLGTKSVRECVEYYYLWKNVCKEEARSFKNIFNSTSATAAECSSVATTRL